jgi:hypothetical protein
LVRYSSGQRGQTVNLLRKLRRFESYSHHNFLVFEKKLKKGFDSKKSESSSVGRASAFQAECRRFEPGLSL